MVDHGFFYQSSHGFYTQSDHGFRRRAKRLLFTGGDNGTTIAEEVVAGAVVNLGAFSPAPGDPTGLDITAYGDSIYMGYNTPLTFSPSSYSDNGVLIYDADLDTWSEVSFGTNGPVSIFKIHGGKLRMGGAFIGVYTTSAHEISAMTSAPYLVAWNGTGWEPMISSIANQLTTPYALMTRAGQLWVGSNRKNQFPNPNTGPVYIWNGLDSVSYVGGADDFGTGITRVFSLVEFEGDVIACGTFDDGGSIQGVARWNGVSWQAMGSLDLDVSYSLVVYNDVLYISGPQASSGVTAKMLKWTGSAWTAAQSLGADITNVFTDMTVHDGLLWGTGGLGGYSYDGTELTAGPVGISGIDPAVTAPQSGKVTSV